MERLERSVKEKNYSNHVLPQKESTERATKDLFSPKKHTTISIAKSKNI